MPIDGAGSLSPELLADVLAPYKGDCRYVIAADCWRDEDAGAVTLDAQLAIGPSCYLDGDGLFQPPEFNICYNQLLYLVLAHGVDRGLLPELADWDYAEFKRRQLPDVLILEFRCEFADTAIQRSSFRGSITIDKISVKRRLTLLKTRCSFDDEHGAHAEGNVTIAIVNPPDRE